MNTDLTINNNTEDQIYLDQYISAFKLLYGTNAYVGISYIKDKNFNYWGIAKVSPKEDDCFFTTNYQFLQVLNLDNQNKIEDICKPTIDWLNSIIHQDYNATLLYLLGNLSNITEEEANNMDLFNSIDDYMVKALILNPDILRDPYIKSKISRSLNRKINDAYIGKLLVDGNFQIMVSDPYAFCEYIFGLEVKGLLNDGEYYSNFWKHRGINKIIAQRAPLTHTSESVLLDLKENKINGN